MNLHSIVRSAITSVNPDTPVDLAPELRLRNARLMRTQVPIYQPNFGVMVQIQGTSAQDLQHVNYLNLQSVLRKIYAYSAVNGAVRVALQGGDLLVFEDWNPVPVLDSNGGFIYDSNGDKVMTFAQRYWKVVQVLERWPDNVANGWTSAIIAEQTDSTRFVIDSNGDIAVDSNGQLVTSQ